MTTSEERMERLVALMRRSLAGYAQGTVTLSQLVSDIESLIDGLEEVSDREWVEELRSNWWRLELTYAMSADEQRPLTHEERAAVADAVEALGVMLVAY